MAKRIDKAALNVLLTALYYLFFLNALGSIPLACAAAFASVVLTHRLLRGLPVRRRATTAQARAELLRIAGLDDDTAEAALTALVKSRWPEETFRLAPILKHPEASLSSGDVLNAWKANRQSRRLVIAATCPCEPRALLFAGELHCPDVAVVDSRGLLRLLRAQPADSLPGPTRLSFKQRLKQVHVSVVSARPSPRSALLALALLASYPFSGNAWCLFSGLVMLAHTGAALIRHGAGRRLFD